MHQHDCKSQQWNLAIDMYVVKGHFSIATWFTGVYKIIAAT